MLLNVVKGPQRCEEIRTVEGVIYATFQEACNALSLLDNDNEWDAALEEAAFSATPISLRNLFSTITIFYEVADPISLWEKYWLHMSGNIKHQLESIYNLQHYRVSDEQIKDQTLSTLELLFNANGTSLEQFKFPLPYSNVHASSIDWLVMEELDYNCYTFF